jgi:two-component system, NarL family, nitrate/nitrite response regulator NarL
MVRSEMPSSSARTTIVVVDDHDAVRRSLVTMLDLEGFDVVGAATTGAEGRALFRERKPALAVLDYELPDITGVELAREAALLSPPTGIVLYTAHVSPASTDEALAEALSSHATTIREVVSKAAGPAELLRVLTELARPRRSPPSRRPRG